MDYPSIREHDYDFESHKKALIEWTGGAVEQCITNIDMATNKIDELRKMVVEGHSDPDLESYIEILANNIELFKQNQSALEASLERLTSEKKNL